MGLALLPFKTLPFSLIVQFIISILKMDPHAIELDFQKEALFVNLTSLPKLNSPPTTPLISILCTLNC